MKTSSFVRLFCGIAISAGVASSAACGGDVLDETGSANDDGGAARDSGAIPHRTTDGGSDATIPGDTSVELQMFVTKDAYPATFGGLIGATQICMNEATDAGLPGTWNPYFCGGPGMDAKGMIAAGKRYALMTGDLVFEEDDAYVHGALAPIDIDTDYRVPGWIPDSAHIALWTGCTFDGRYASNRTCNDFSEDAPSTSGFGGIGVDTMWGGGAPIDCDQKAGILCVEQ